MSDLLIKTRRPRLTLWSLDINLDPIEELDEITSFKCNYSLTQIPYATVGVAVGINIEDRSLSPIQEDINTLIKEKAPVGVVVEFDYMRTSEDYKDPDREKWPKDPVFIFKGYVASYTVNKLGTQFSMNLVLHHWLIDLTAISMYSPRAYVSADTKFAADLVNIGIKNVDNTISSWGLSNYTTVMNIFNDKRVGISDKGEVLEVKNTMWDCLLFTIRAIIETSKVFMGEGVFGKIDQTYLTKQDNALKRLKSCLEYTAITRDALGESIQQLADTIDKEAADEWIGATVWDKIAGPYLSKYYYSIVPTANTAYIIPTPATIPDTHIDITQDEIIAMYAREPVTPVLGAVAMAIKTGKDDSYDGVNPTIPIMYPPQGKNVAELKNSIGGPIMVIKAPDYLETTVVNYPPQKLVDINVTDVPRLEVKENKEKAVTKKSSINEKQGKVLYELTALEYLSKVFAGRQCTITMSFRGDIVPGACVHVHIDKNKVMQEQTDIDIYGVVQYVSLDVTDKQATTTIGLFNLRNEHEFNSELYNPQIAPFYANAFNGTEASLYCPK